MQIYLSIMYKTLENVDRKTIEIACFMSWVNIGIYDTKYVWIYPFYHLVLIIEGDNRADTVA